VSGQETGYDSSSWSSLAREEGSERERETGRKELSAEEQRVHLSTVETIIPYHPWVGTPLAFPLRYLRR